MELTPRPVGVAFTPFETRTDVIARLAVHAESIGLDRVDVAEGWTHDSLIVLAELAGRTSRIVRWTEMPRGGHFAAFEEPELYAEDLRAFFRPYRRA